ncbi:MAG TPA: hypothetical protein VF719_06740, partial [Abditibacteriaceae bacterium]
TDRISLQLNVFIDPKLEIVPSSGRFTITEAVDENGKSLQATGGISSINSSGRYVLGLPISFDAKEVTGKKIARIKGSFSVVYVAKSQRWEIPNAVEAKNVAFAGTPAATLTELKATPTAYQAQVAYETVLGDEVLGGMSRLIDFYARRARLITPERELGARSGGARGPRMNAPESPTKRYESTLVFGQRGRASAPVNGPVTFVWDVPTAFAHAEVPFEFANLPLPQ